jgi:hypothetical protein
MVGMIPERKPMKAMSVIAGAISHGLFKIEICFPVEALKYGSAMNASTRDAANATVQIRIDSIQK